MWVKEVHVEGQSAERGTGFGEMIQREERDRGDVSRVTPPKREGLYNEDKFLKMGRWDHGKANQGQMVISKGKMAEEKGRVDWFGFSGGGLGLVVKGTFTWVSLLSLTCRLSHPARRSKWVTPGFKEDE